MKTILRNHVMSVSGNYLISIFLQNYKKGPRIIDLQITALPLWRKIVAKPKSTILRTSLSSRRRFSGLISLWVTPSECRYSTPLQKKNLQTKTRFGVKCKMQNRSSAVFFTVTFSSYFYIFLTESFNKDILNLGC